MANVSVQPNGCWLWTGACFDSGYGAFPYEGKTQRAHRVSWKLHRGPIPPGVLVCHRCDNPPCVNPDDLFLGSHADNHADQVEKGRQLKGGDHPRRLNPDAWSPEKMSEGARNRWANMTPEERAELGAAMGASRLGKKRGPYQRHKAYPERTPEHAEHLAASVAASWEQRLAENPELGKQTMKVAWQESARRRKERTAQRLALTPELCACGCGTRLSDKSRLRGGLYSNGHNSRMRRWPDDC